MNAQVPIIRYDPEAAKKAWEDYLAAVEEEKIAQAKRVLAHNRFMVAFMRGAA